MHESLWILPRGLISHDKAWHAYFDVLKGKAEFGVPCFAYQVSGEYSMLCASFQNGWLTENAQS